MNVMVFTMALWSQDIYVTPAADVPLAHVLNGVFRYLCMLFALPVLVLLGGPILESALTNLRRGYFTTDLLLMAGVIASFLYSIVSVLCENGPVYFEVGCVVLLFVTFGRWLEALGKLKAARAAQSIQKLLPEKVRRIAAGDESIVALEAIAVGDHLRILPGERIPCDGLVLERAVTVDEQIVTGESAAIVRQPGERVLGGSLNLDSVLLVEVTATPEEGAIGRLIQQIRAAQQTKGHYQRLADRVAAWFLPLVVLIALGTLIYHGWFFGLGAGILASLAVVLIACPCALGIATPLALWVALGKAAEQQILFRNGEALERLAFIRALRFDKTGTLTTGESAVCDFVAAVPQDVQEVKRRAGLLAAQSTHQHSRAIGQYVGGDPGTNGFEVLNIPGQGLLATSHAGDDKTWLGSVQLMHQAGLHVPDSLPLQRVEPLACIGWDGGVRGVFLFHEELRPEAAGTLQQLRERGIDVAILTGDHEARGRVLAAALHVRIEAQMLPEDKVRHLRQTQRDIGPVAMVGDGINDGPALATSDVGIAMGCGADVAQVTSAICLLGNDLSRIPWVIDLARRTVRIIRQNLFWAFAYNVLGIGLACTGLLNPIFASVAMALSSLAVVANSMRVGVQPPLTGRAT